MKVCFCIPTVTKPYQATLDSLKASVPLIEKEWDHVMVSEVGCPYISNARATMLRKALDARADVIVFIDHDLSWKPRDLLTLINTEGDVVAGTYRFKEEGPARYMGACQPYPDGSPQVRSDGALRAFSAPAGFLKITKDCVNTFIGYFPELCYGDRYSPHIDLFNHGAHEGVWYGEDYAFCRRWKETGGDVIICPDLSISHWSGDVEYKGNYHDYLQGLPGGSREAA